MVGMTPVGRARTMRWSRAGRSGRAGRGAGQAGRVQSHVGRHARPRAVARSHGADGPLGQRPLERVQRQQGALEACRADLDAQQLQHVVLGQLRPARPWCGPRSVSVSSDADAWLMAQPRPVNATSVTVPDVVEVEHQRQPVAAQRVGALVRDVGVLAACRSCAAAGSAPGSRRGTGHPWDVTGYRTAAASCATAASSRVRRRRRPAGPCAGPPRAGRCRRWWCRR